MQNIRPIIVLAMAVLVLPLMTLVYLKVRERDQKILAAYRTELVELRDLIESHVQVLSKLDSRVEMTQEELSRVNRALAGATGTTPPPVVAELNRRISELAEQQARLLARFQQQSPHIMESVSPEQRRQLHEAGIAVLDARLTEQLKAIEDSETNLESLRAGLGVPDEVAIMDSDKGADDPRLLAYRSYFEAKRGRDKLRMFARILETKLVAEKIDLSVPRSP